MLSLKYTTKKFSIKDGRYTGGKVNPISKSKAPLIAGGITGSLLGGMAASESNNPLTGAIIGGGIGMGLGALARYFFNCIRKSEFNKDYGTGSIYRLIDTLDALIVGDGTSISRSEQSGSTTVTTTVTQRTKRRLEGVAYDIDKDPKNYKVSIAYEGNVMLFYLPNIDERFMKLMDSELNAICHTYSKANYKSYLVGKNSYVVELLIVGDSYWYIPYDLYHYGIKFNLLTLNNMPIKR